MVELVSLVVQLMVVVIADVTAGVEVKGSSQEQSWCWK